MSPDDPWGGFADAPPQKADPWASFSDAPPQPKQEPDQPKDEGLLAGFGYALTGLAGNLVAGAQRTSPIVKNLEGGSNYMPLGEMKQADSGPIYVGPDGKWVPFDPAQHVVLNDPKSGKPTIYARSEKTDEGVLPSAGRVLGIGALAPSNIGLTAAAGAPSRAQALLKDFADVGVDPTLPAVSQSRTAQIAQNTLRETPGAAGAVENRAKQAVAQTGEAAERLAGDYGAATNEKQAGDIIQEAVQNFANKARPKTGALTADQAIAAPTRATSISQKAGALFDRVGSYFRPDDQIDLTNTLSALKGPVDRFPTNPELGKLITNPKLRQYFEVLAPREKEIPGVAPAPFDETGMSFLDTEAPGLGSARSQSMAASARSRYGEPMSSEPALPTGAEPRWGFDADGKIAPSRPAQTVTTGGTLTFPEVKELRSTIGRMLDGSSLVSDIPRGDLKSVYGALSRDLEAAAADKGQAALTAFRRANGYYTAAMDRVDQLEGLLGKSSEGAYGAVLRAAQDGTRGDISKLWSVRRAMPDDQWGNIAATTLRTMGKPTAGAAGDADFSVSTFLTNYSKLSDAGKNVIFNSTDMGPLRAQLDKLVNVVGAQKNVARLANTSGTGRVTIAGLLGAAFVNHPVTAALTLAGGNIGARAMMNPGFVRWLYAGPKTMDLAPWVANLSRLDQLATNDAALKPVAQYLRQSLEPMLSHAESEDPNRRNRP